MLRWRLATTCPWWRSGLFRGFSCSRAPSLPWIPHACDCLLLHDQSTPPHILSVWSSRDGLRGIAIRYLPHIFLILSLLFRDTFHGYISFLWSLVFVWLLHFYIVIVYCSFYCCILLLLLWFGVGFVMWPALLLVVVFWYLFLYYCMFVVCFVYYLLLVLLVLSARDVRPGWMPPPRWGVYGMPMSEAWVAFLPRGSPYTRSSELFSSQAHGCLFLWSFAFLLLFLMVVPRWSPIPRTPNE